MHEQMRLLAGMQAAEQRARSLEAEIIALPKRVQQAEAAVKAAEAALAANAQSQQAEEKRRRSLESDAASLRAKIQRYRNQAETIANDAQYQALMHEIAFAESEISTAETRELESLEQTDELLARQEMLNGALGEAKLHLEQEQKYVRTTSARLHGELSSAREEQKTLRAQVSPEWLVRYDGIAKTRRTAVSEVIEGECQACHMRLRPQQWNQLREGADMRCETCGRLLYYDEGNDHRLAAKAAGQWEIP